MLPGIAASSLDFDRGILCDASIVSKKFPHPSHATWSPSRASRFILFFVAAICKACRFPFFENFARAAGNLTFCFCFSCDFNRDLSRLALDFSRAISLSDLPVLATDWQFLQTWTRFDGANCIGNKQVGQVVVIFKTVDYRRRLVADCFGVAERRLTHYLTCIAFPVLAYFAPRPRSVRVFQAVAQC